jgi:hypothetical protein
MARLIRLTKPNVIAMITGKVQPPLSVEIDDEVAAIVDEYKLVGESDEDGLVRAIAATQAGNRPREVQ